MNFELMTLSCIRPIHLVFVFLSKTHNSHSASRASRFRPPFSTPHSFSGPVASVVPGLSHRACFERSLNPTLNVDVTRFSLYTSYPAAKV